MPKKLIIIIIVLTIVITGCSKNITEKNIKTEKKEVEVIMQNWFSNYLSRLNNDTFQDDYKHLSNITNIQNIYPIYKNDESSQIDWWLITFEDKNKNCMLPVMLREGKKTPGMWSNDCDPGTPNQLHLEKYKNEYNDVAEVALLKIIETDRKALGQYYSLYNISYKNGLNKIAKIYRFEDLEKCIENKTLDCREYLPRFEKH